MRAELGQFELLSYPRRFAIPGSEGRKVAVQFDQALDLAYPGVDLSDGPPGLSRAEFLRPAEAVPRLRESPQVSQRETQDGMRVGEVGLEADGLLARSDRLRQLLLGVQGASQVVVSLGIVGLETDGLL